MERMICLLAGYLCGLFQTGYLYGKAHHIDIRQYGSGNAGTTNALRVLGKKAGLIVFLGDFLKAFLPCIAIRILFADRPEVVYLLLLYTGLGVILGHNYPCYLKFKGGKGIAAMAGLLTATDVKMMLLCLITFVLLVAVTRFVSLGSLVVAAEFFLWTAVSAVRGGYGLGDAYVYEFCALSFLVAAMAFWRHRANISRLLSGTENKLGSGSK